MHWCLYPAPADLRFSWRNIYIQADSARHLPFYVRQPFTTYHVDLTLSEEERWGNYTPKLRQNIRKARQFDFKIIRNHDLTRFLDIYTPIWQALGLIHLQESHFATKSPEQYLITFIEDETHGVLAAHVVQLDHATKKVKLEYNASTFRRFENGTGMRRLCGQANALLFELDFGYFQNLGYEVFDFGGYDERPTLQHFKRQFGGKVVTNYNYFPFWFTWAKAIKNWLT
ncbi:MAG: hypothetical protein AAGJ82_15740 [Bacteroidota bacterium]